MAHLTDFSAIFKKIAERTPDPEPLPPVHWVEPPPRCVQCHEFPRYGNSYVCRQCEKENAQGYKSMSLLGRLRNGAALDRGTLNHAVMRVISGKATYWEKSLCGAKPGRLSVGWTREISPVTCPRCLKKIEKMNHKESS